MSQILLESPFAIAIGGLFVAGFAVFWGIQTGGRWANYFALIAAGLTAILVMLSVQIETDNERIRRTIDEVRAALASNDFERVDTYIHARATPGVERAKRELPQFKFSEARMTRLKSIAVNRGTSPPTALAEFNVVVAAESQGQKFRVPRFVKLYFMEQDGRWLVRDYEHLEPTAGFR